MPRGGSKKKPRFRDDLSRGFPKEFLCVLVWRTRCKEHTPPEGRVKELPPCALDRWGSEGQIDAYAEKLVRKEGGVRILDKMFAMAERKSRAVLAHARSPRLMTYFAWTWWTSLREVSKELAARGFRKPYAAKSVASMLR